MTLQVLVATMNQSDHSLLDRMNIQSDTIVVNQCERNEIEEFSYHGHKIKWISLAEKGVGLSRNTAWMRADADIILFADDDIRYIDNYPKLVEQAFDQQKDSNMLVFDVDIMNDNRAIRNYRRITKVQSLHWYNSMRYGACRFAVRRKAMLKANLSYSLLFGGGAVYGSGEDSLFIRDSLRHHMGVIAYPLVIAEVDSGDSSWYTGNNDKYYQDKGALYYTAFPKIYPLLYCYYAFRDRKKANGFLYILKLYRQGKENWKSM